MTSQTDYSAEIQTLPAKQLLKEMQAGRRDTWQLAPHQIHVVEGLNLREENDSFRAGLEALAQSIISEGFYQDKPLAVTAAFIDGQERIILLDGHRRHAAVKIAIAKGCPIERVPCVFKDKSQDSADLTVSLIRSNQGVGFTVLELSTGVKRLKKYGLEDADVAQRLGITWAYVQDLLILAGAPSTVRQLVASEKVAATFAIQALRKHKSDAESILLKAVEAAQKVGKTTASAKHLPGNARKKYFKKNATPLGEILSKISQSDLFEQLPEDLKFEVRRYLSAAPE